ncbi:MAG: thymidylate kinase [Nitrospinales bacterium]|jgi:thymidylate kinase
MNTLPLIKDFFETLNSRQVEYCHWKSNHAIKSFLQGEGDLDLLVSDSSRTGFEDALSEFNFKLAVSPAWEETASVYHYYGLDEETGRIVHLHIYFKLLSGGMLIKNYHLPFESLLLDRSNESEGIKIPDKASELLVFVIRKILECSSTPDYLFVIREEENIKKEFNWLFDSETLDQTKKLLLHYSPKLTPLLFDEYIQALQSKPKFFTRVSLSKKLHKVFSDNAVNSPIKNKQLTWEKFFHVLYQKFISKKQVYNFFGGGALIAFVGADGSGKSTHITKIEKWLTKMVFVDRIHTGLPPATSLTFFPRLFLPLFRKLFPSQRVNSVELKQQSSDIQEKKDVSYSILFLVRSIMVAFDQKQLANAARYSANKGKIIISDRYPSAALGGMDGPRVDPSFFDNGSPFKRFLARIEKKIYNNISKPDLVFKLTIPLELTLQRLAEREEEMDDEPEKQIRCRQAVMDKWKLPGVPIHDIDNSAPLEDVQKKIKKIIWSSI